MPMTWFDERLSMHDDKPRLCDMPAPQMRATHPALSELLSQVACDEALERVSVANILERAGDRAFGALLFVFAFPNVVPMPPGASAVLGLPLVLLAGQFLCGRKTPWLPRVIRKRAVPRRDFATLLVRISPVLRRIERVLRPRFGLLVGPAAERIIGLVLLVLSVILFLPIPLGNMLPAAAICLISLALIEHDGLIVVVGAILAALAILLVWGAVVAVLRTTLAAFDYFDVFGT